MLICSIPKFKSFLNSSIKTFVPLDNKQKHLYTCINIRSNKSVFVFLFYNGVFVKNLLAKSLLFF